MVSHHMLRPVLAAALFGLGTSVAPLHAANAAAATVAPAQASVQQHGHGIDVMLGRNRIELRLVRGNVLHVHYQPDGKSTPPSLVIAPDAPRLAAVPVKVGRHGDTMTLSSPSLEVSLNTRTLALSVTDPVHHRSLVQQADLAALVQGKLDIRYAAGAPMYGIHSFSAQDGPLYGTPDCTTVEHDTTGLLRLGRQVAKACPEGGAGAPFVWSTRGFGLLLDTKTATFNVGDRSVSVSNTSRPDLSYYIIAGRPDAIFGALADLSGHAPLFPKWAMGFTNSQWGIDQKELLDIIHTYRAKHIPIDNFTLDFDWKAWGQNDYGEFRWNPKKFPEGPSGKLAKVLAAEGVHLTGIMKPRIHVNTVEGRYATAHDLWVPGEKASKDYFSHKLVRDIDFDKPAARRWFGAKTIQYGFDKGMVGWWNDEADEINDNTQFLNMERSLYDAQRAHTDIRVWSINRSFWLGAQRYAYGLWSGDIKSGFKSMARQRLRMLNAINVGAMQWGMDGGGFDGHPSDQNYARWIEFGAFTPIFRVHGTHNEKRQPWRYGAIAEKAATGAIRLRYKLLPYIYSYAWQEHLHGIGLVRPLTFRWPHDPKVRNDVNAWMFGDWLLVSPVVVENQTVKHVYLPAGTWTDWFSGKVYRGGQAVTLDVNSQSWDDIPLFVRQGAIIPTQPPMDYVGEKPLTEVTVDVFPAEQRSSFDYYDDNGTTYAYEHGRYFQQTLTTQRHGDAVQFATDKPIGSFKPRLAFYLLKIHGGAASAVRSNGKNMVPFGDLATLRGSKGEGWATSHDRFGPVTYVRIAAAKADAIQLAMPQ